MIKNELQYEVTKDWAEKFARAIVAVRQSEERRKTDPDGWQLLQDSYQSQLESLQDEIDEYETLIAHDPNQPVVLNLDDINKISELLIKARIAFKITQKELAYMCDRTEDEIKAYEERNYHNSSFLDFLAVIDSLGIQCQEGRFYAVLDDFYKDRLVAIRQSENFNAA
ncbi:MAG TPA: hypothetical protein DCL61_13355 [Cyanobacteria bacterium UBA12227]|nr:hypothetical protein [Cyanobacteria bacterium UBA12227]HAX86694.1 hypothetical protein [Cyanobacteria bacterium UBA11370]HBY77100.1 hypothetical protein [Cyanobacteria bacterium UBA11148]